MRRMMRSLTHRTVSSPGSSVQWYHLSLMNMLPAHVMPGMTFRLVSCRWSRQSASRSWTSSTRTGRFLPTWTGEDSRLPHPNRDSCSGCLADRSVESLTSPAPASFYAAECEPAPFLYPLLSIMGLPSCYLTVPNEFGVTIRLLKGGGFPVLTPNPALTTVAQYGAEARRQRILCPAVNESLHFHGFRIFERGGRIRCNFKNIDQCNQSALKKNPVRRKLLSHIDGFCLS